jgi:hypothetical protein
VSTTAMMAPEVVVGYEVKSADQPLTAEILARLH